MAVRDWLGCIELGNAALTEENCLVASIPTCLKPCSKTLTVACHAQMKSLTIEIQ